MREGTNSKIKKRMMPNLFTSKISLTEYYYHVREIHSEIYKYLINRGKCCCYYCYIDRISSV